MKKNIYSLAALLFCIGAVNAKQVESATAKQVAENFIHQTAKVKAVDLVLTHTERSAAGIADYYIFDVNSNTGFIIVSAEDAGAPILGYSLEGPFVQPSASSNPNFNYWLEGRKSEIEYIRYNNLQPSAAISNDWIGYAGNLKKDPTVLTVPPLCAAQWDQGGAYNDQCPGGSVTGCVATAMAIIMKKWAFPTQGTGSSSYNAGSYGTLSANYGATTYNWAAMTTPYCTGTNAAVATIMSHCGISVEMSYSPSGSGAMVCGNPGAQHSYTAYFKYDAATLKCQMQANDPNWVTTLENEFIAGRPVQYQGVGGSGGHTWVADGFDASNHIHMNWGWSGSSNGYFDVNNLNPGGMTFTSQLGGLIGIQPGITAALDAGIPAITTPSGTTCNTTFSPVISLKNFGSTALTSCTINYKVDNNANQTFSWTGSLATGASVNVTLPAVTVSAGAHTFTSSSSSPNSSTDGNTSNDQTQSSFNVATGTASLPVQEGFEAATTLPSGWTIANPDNDGTWIVSATVGKSSTHSMFIDNCNPPTNTSGMKDRFISPVYDFQWATSANMTFDVAYAKLILSGTTYGDTLAVLASTNCGSTWSTIYVKGGTTLATAPDLTAAAPTCFTPTAAQWRNDNINLSSLLGQSSVMFAFESRSQWGEGIYVDNLNITSVTGIAPMDAHSGFSIYPNPASTLVTIEGAAKSEKIHYAICNMLGAEIRSGDIAASGNTFSGKIQVSDISNGMYFLKVTDGDSSYTKKLNKQ
jgi:hypothetical protein